MDDLLDEECGTTNNNVHMNFLASSPPSDDSLSRPSTSRSIPLLRSRRTVPLSLPILSTSPTSNITTSDSTVPIQPPLPSPVNILREVSSAGQTASTSVACIEHQQPRSKPTAKDLESHVNIVQETGHMLDISDFECSLCFRIFLQPVTTVCGHVFCKQCIFTSLKYNLHCPLCRSKLESSSKHTPDQRYSVNIVLMNVIEKYFPKEHQERLQEDRIPQKSVENNEQKAEVAMEDQQLARPASPTWNCILPSLRTTCTVLLSCGGF